MAGCRRGDLKWQAATIMEHSSSTQPPQDLDVKEVDKPHITQTLLMRAGDVESNPGPKCKDKSHSEKEEDFDDILKKVAHLTGGNIAIDTLGKALGFHPADIEMYIATNTRGQHVTYGGTLKMLRDWRNTQRKTKERSVLAEAFRKTKREDLAELLTTSDDVPHHDLLESVVTDIKKYYKLNMCTIQADPTNNDVMFEFNHIYTEPTLSEGDRNDKTIRDPLLYCNLLKTKINGQLPNRLLVQAEGGAGKTTFCSKIAWDWANDLGFQKFRLVAVIPLRKAKNKTVGEVIKSYLPDNNPFTAAQIDEYILSNQEDVFLVFDGLDELWGKLSDLHQIVLIILNRLFMSGTVLVTSRQWRAHDICSITELKKVYAFIYIEAFSPDNVTAYIKKFFNRDAASSQELIDFITSNDVIADNMAHFPIFIAMLCIMWREYDGERREAMSKLMTFPQVFDEMVDFLVDHCGSKDDSQTGPTVQELRQMIPNHLKAIGEIAFQGILDKRLEFPENTFQSCRESMEIGCKVGVLTREKHATPRRDRRNNPRLEMSMVQFPHKLFQEFTAAKYLASLHSSDHGRYERIMATIIERGEEFRYLLYFTSAQGSELGLDIVTRFIAQEKYDHIDEAYECNKELSLHMRSCEPLESNSSSSTHFQENKQHFIVDVAYESQHQSVAKKVGNQFMRGRKCLNILYYWSAHTLSGLLFIKDHLGEVDSLVLQKKCGRTASQDLAEFILSSASMRKMEICMSSGLIRDSMHAVFYSMLADKVQQCQIESILILNFDLSKQPSESRDLAKIICKLPQLQDLNLESNKLHKDFYRTAQSMASSAKIQNLKIRFAFLKGQPSRDLAKFICHMPHLESLKLSYSSLHKDFFPKWASIVSSTKGNNQSTTPHTSLRELSVDDYMVIALQSCGDMFDSVEKLSICFWRDFECDFIQRVRGFQGVTELSILQGFLGVEITSCHVKGEPSTMIKHLVRVFPQLIKLTFTIDLGNAIFKQILESLRETRGLPLKSVRIRKCGVVDGQDELSALIDIINDENIFRIEVETLGNDEPEQRRVRHYYSPTWQVTSYDTNGDDESGGECVDDSDDDCHIESDEHSFHESDDELDDESQRAPGYSDDMYN